VAVIVDAAAFFVIVTHDADADLSAPGLQRAQSASVCLDGQTRLPRLRGPRRAKARDGSVHSAGLAPPDCGKPTCIAQARERDRNHDRDYQRDDGFEDQPDHDVARSRSDAVDSDRRRRSADDRAALAGKIGDGVDLYADKVGDSEELHHERSSAKQPHDRVSAPALLN
jgi:hypothetical protein